MRITLHTLAVLLGVLLAVAPVLAAGMMMTPAGERVTGRHDTTKTRLRAVVQFADGSQNRNPLEGFVTDSARDAVLWASELASSGNFRRALEIPHAVLTTAFAQHG